jgi:flagellar protein FlgJ
MALRGTSLDANAALALDANALASLKAQAKNAPEQALAKAAGQFEALFVSMVLKSMRDALPQDGPLASESTKTYTAMFDQQLALTLSERGIGLRKAIEKQLARALAPAADVATQPSAAAPPVDNRTQPSAPAPPAAAAKRAAAAYARPPAVARPSQQPLSAAPAAAPREGGAVSAVTTFIEKMRPHAEAAARALGLPVQFLLAQAGLETGWGRSQPKTADGASSHNLFGVKSGRRWSGAIAQATTTEYVGGRATPTPATFRAYGSYAESMNDFARLLKGSRRYADALAQAGDPRAYATSLQRAGYATDPAYADKLARAIALVSRHTRSPPAPQLIASGADTRKDGA